MNFVISRLLDNCNLDFVKYKKISFSISFVLILLSIVLFFVNGINFGIDFTGGTLLELESRQNLNISEIRAKLSDHSDLKSPTIQLLNEKNLIIKFKSQNGDSDVELIKNILQQYDFEYKKIDYVGPQISQSLIKKGISALVLALFGIFIYLTAMFDYRYGIGGVLSLVHDILIILGVYILFQIEFNTSAIAAILTIVGYSINDSVVIFDRIRENAKKFKDKVNLVNYSINSTLSRTILTSFTTLLAILPIIFFCNGEIKDFATIIFSGVIIGTYSSIFIASSIALLSNKRSAKR